MRKQREEYVDAALESHGRDVQERINILKKDPCYKHIRLLAKELRDLKLDAFHVLSCYRQNYERRGLRFIEIAKEALEVSALVPERITRTDGGDRSAHALIERSAREMREEIGRICGEAPITADKVRQVDMGSSTMTAL